MAFTQRKSAPASNNKYYLHTSVGGLNQCLKILANGSVLPNCVGYAWGRAYEILGKKPTLSRANAEDWYGYNDGYSRSKTPRQGDIACWYGPGALCGHVAVVEQVNSDGSIIISESNYGGVRWRRYTLKKPYYQYGLVFQGFIHLPIKTTTTNKPSTTQSGFKVGDTVTPKKLVDVNGKTLKQYDKYYVITALNGNQATLAAVRNGKKINWATLLTTNLTKYTATSNTTVTKAVTVGATVKVNKGAKDLNTGTTYASFVYNTKYKVLSMSGNRVVFGTNKNQVIGATNKSNLTVV